MCSGVSVSCMSSCSGCRIRRELSLDWQELFFHCFVSLLLLYGTLCNSWRFLVAWNFSVSDALISFVCFFSTTELHVVEKHVVDAFGVDAYYMIACDFRKLNLTLMVPWHCLFLSTFKLFCVLRFSSLEFRSNLPFKNKWIMVELHPTLRYCPMLLFLLEEW